MSAVHVKSKKSSATKAKTSASKSKAATMKTSSHPPFADIIRECIIDAGDRTGVSRSTIKKFVEDKYKMVVTPSVISNINRAITYGAEKGSFVLPKGPSGKVKLAPKNRTSDSAKENTRPVKVAASGKKPTPKLPVKSAKKPKTAVKGAPNKKSVTSKKTTTVKRASKSSAPSKKTTSKRAPAKKSITGTTKAKVAPKSKTSTRGKASAVAPPSKRKAASTVKPTSKATSAKTTSPKK